MLLEHRRRVADSRSRLRREIAASGNGRRTRRWCRLGQLSRWTRWTDLRDRRRRIGLGRRRGFECGCCIYGEGQNFAGRHRNPVRGGNHGVLGRALAQDAADDPCGGRAGNRVMAGKRVALTIHNEAGENHRKVKSRNTFGENDHSGRPFGHRESAEVCVLVHCGAVRLADRAAGRVQALVHTDGDLEGLCKSTPAKKERKKSAPHHHNWQADSPP